MNPWLIVAIVAVVILPVSKRARAGGYFVFSVGHLFSRQSELLEA